jgi:C-3',4' desaturase CrtD
MPHSIIVIGAGIGGLTAGALLACRGYDVTVYEQAEVPGGCASTFKRQGFNFDVGATQVAGLEPEGIHQRIFAELGIDIPPATPCDPACAVFLPGETEPIQVWRDSKKWQVERQKQFPGSEPFWQLMAKLFRASWNFQRRDPVLPPCNIWDLWQLISALRLDTFATVPFSLMTVVDALRLYGLANDQRLKTFLDLQLKLYSQVNADETALLYAATALAVSQSPQGLYHFQGSMQVLSDCLVEALEKHGGKLKLGYSIEKIHPQNNHVEQVTIHHQKTGETQIETADHVVANVTIQNLIKLLDISPSLFWKLYKNRAENLPRPSGAFVVYLGVDRRAIPDECFPHLQFLYDYTQPISENNSLFISVSKPGDGRAADGKATIIASSFTDPQIWFHKTPKAYKALKRQYTSEVIARLSSYFHITPDTIIHQEAATPCTFARFTARDQGIVGGVGQRVSTFGPFGIATRTPLNNLWLVGDSTHPGEGTAGVNRCPTNRNESVIPCREV